MKTFILSQLLLLTVFVRYIDAACPFTGKISTEDGGHRIVDCPHARSFREELKSSPPDEGQKTFKGCTCKSSCSATVDDLYKCDWCYTEDGCGHFGISGHYDYCAYPDQEDFEKQTFEEKNKFFWSEITKDTQRADKYASPLSILDESIRTTFDNYRDFMPNTRVKGIHSVGVICPFTLDITEESHYTGLFEAGEQLGFVRMGSAADPVSQKGITPGLGIKFARTGVHSGNYVALHSLTLGQSWNFFAYNMSNHIAAPDEFVTEQIAKKFQQASQCAPQVGLSDMARYSQDGKEHDAPIFPFKLFLIPSDEVQTPAVEKTIDEINAEMEKFPVGTTLFKVYACGKAASSEAEMTPTDGGLKVACAEPLLLGNMVSTDTCTSSLYGDTKFFIRHQRIEDDWKINPSFLSSYDAAKACGWSGPISADGAPPVCSD